MAMESKRIPYLVFLFILLFAFQVTEFALEAGATPTGEYGQQADVGYNDTGIDTANVDIIGGIFDFFVIGIDGTPMIITLIFTVINGILLTLFGYIIATIVLDALPFTGG